MDSYLNNSFPFVSFQEKIDLGISLTEDRNNAINSSFTMNFMKIFNDSESIDPSDQIEQNDQVNPINFEQTNQINYELSNSKKKINYEDISYSMEQPYFESSHLNIEEEFLKIGGEEGQNKGIDPIQKINIFEQGNNDSFIHENNYFIGDLSECGNNSYIDLGNQTTPTIDFMNNSTVDDSELQKIKKNIMSLKISNSSMTANTTNISGIYSNSSNFINKSTIHSQSIMNVSNSKNIFNITSTSNNDALNGSYNAKSRRGRKKLLLDGIKTEVLDRSLVREFKKFLKSKEGQFNLYYEEDKTFWNEFLQSTVPPFAFTEEKLEFKSFNKAFLKFIFDKPSVRFLYSKFVKENENDFVTKIILRSRKSRIIDKKLMEFYKFYGKNLHKMYSTEYAALDFLNDEI